MGKIPSLAEYGQQLRDATDSENWEQASMLLEQINHVLRDPGSANTLNRQALESALQSIEAATQDAEQRRAQIKMLLTGLERNTQP